MKTVNINFINIKEELPSRSGLYLVIDVYGLMRVLPYSSKYKKFNANDAEKKESAGQYAIDVIWWAPISKDLKRMGVNER